MYDTLRADLLTASDQERKAMEFDPTAVVSYDIFKNNQFPYLVFFFFFSSPRTSLFCICIIMYLC